MHLAAGFQVSHWSFVESVNLLLILWWRVCQGMLWFKVPSGALHFPRSLSFLPWSFLLLVPASSGVSGWPWKSGVWPQVHSVALSLSLISHQCCNHALNFQTFPPMSHRGNDLSQISTIQDFFPHSLDETMIRDVGKLRQYVQGESHDRTTAECMFTLSHWGLIWRSVCVKWVSFCFQTLIWGLFNPLIIVTIVHFSPTCSHSVSKTYKNRLNHNTLLLTGDSVCLNHRKQTIMW